MDKNKIHIFAKILIRLKIILQRNINTNHYMPLGYK